LLQVNVGDERNPFRRLFETVRHSGEMGIMKKKSLSGPTDWRGTFSFAGIRVDEALLFFLIILLGFGFLGSKVLAEEKVITKRSYEMTDWPLGKIEPIVAQESQTEDYLDVIVYIKAPDLNAVSRKAKGRFKPQIETFSGKIRDIYRKHRLKGAFSRNKEAEMVMEMERAIPAEDRVKLKDLREDLDLHLDWMRREVGRALEDAVGPNQKAIKDFIEARGGSVKDFINLSSALGATIPSDQLMIIAEHPLVLCVTKDRPTELRLDVSVPSAGYSMWWDNDISGGPFDFGIVDDGIQEDHPAFYKMDFYGRPGDTVSGDHGTHVAGIVIAGSPSWMPYPYLGGAHGLGGPTGKGGVIWANRGDSRANEMTAMEWVATEPIQLPEVVNASFGDTEITDTDYDDYAAFFDAYVTHYDTMVTVAAGNFGWNDDSTSLGHPGLSYNILSVVNMDDKNTLARSDDVRDTSSSVGPTPSNRKKPDIVAPGANIMSTNAFWGSGDDHISMSGTSMAAPHVAAAVLLMEDGGNNDPMSQMAVLINTADAWTSNNTETVTDDEEVVGSHWDKSYGWGYLNMEHAYIHRDDYFTDSVVPNTDDSFGFHYKLYKGSMDEGDKSTLVWQKRVDYKAGVVPDTQYALSDLDLALYNEDNGDLVDSATDGDNNVHQVSTPADITSAVIKVNAFSDSFSGATEEPFALATEEDFLPVMKPYASVTLTMPENVDVDESFTITAAVRNTGEVKSHDNELTLIPPPGFTIVSGSDPQNIGSIEPFATASTQAAWTVVAPDTIGNYYVQVNNTSSSYGEAVTDSGIAFVSVVATPPCKGDIDDDDDIDGLDLAILSADFDETDCTGDCEGDLDGDGNVDEADLALFSVDFGLTDCP
jgi:serine protease AprX